MASVDRLKTNAAPFLQPGEDIQAAIFGQTFNPYLALLYQPVILYGKPYRAIAVTNRRILIWRVRGFRFGTVGHAFTELPRDTRIGPASGLWYRTAALGRNLYIHRKSHGEIAAADAALDAGTSPN